jgi:regulator of RNase E activity RraA
MTTELWSTDRELLSLTRRSLFTALVGDVLDTMGFVRQFLPPEIQPLKPDMILAGRAMTVLEADCCGVEISSAGKKAPFGLMFEALDDLREDEVYICAGGAPDYAHWGGLMTMRAVYLKAAGAVMHGYSRDTHQMCSYPFPVFSWGTYAQDQGPRGRVVDYRCAIEFPNGVRVENGDLLFGDIGGVVVIQRVAEKEAVAKALEKAEGENLVAKAISRGMSTVEAFATFGIM